MNIPEYTILWWNKCNTSTALLFFFTLFLGVSAACAEKMLIPMDFKQTDHLKAYGVAYHALSRNISVEWLLNYRGGSFLLDADKEITEYTLTRGVSYETPDAAALARLDETI